MACPFTSASAIAPAAEQGVSVRGAAVIWFVVAMILAGLSVRANDRDEASLTVKVSSAEHEVQEGYFALGPDATLIVKPGSDLHRFLTRQNGQRVRITVTAVGGTELSRLRR